VNDDDDGHHGDPERPDYDRVRDRDLSGDRGALGLAMVSEYIIKKGPFPNEYAILRLDGDGTVHWVQMNIRTRDKANAALKDWQQREAENDRSGS
jgi:hypothetical protein